MKDLLKRYLEARRLYDETLKHFESSRSENLLDDSDAGRLANGATWIAKNELRSAEEALLSYIREHHLPEVDLPGGGSIDDVPASHRVDRAREVAKWHANKSQRRTRILVDGVVVQGVPGA